jgi:hypothetical protein
MYAHRHVDPFFYETRGVNFLLDIPHKKNISYWIHIETRKSLYTKREKK